MIYSTNNNNNLDLITSDPQNQDFDWGDGDDFDFGAVGGSNTPIAVRKVSNPPPFSGEEKVEDVSMEEVVLNLGERVDGECLMRISTRTLLVKDWKPGYWFK